MPYKQWGETTHGRNDPSYKGATTHPQNKGETTHGRNDPDSLIVHETFFYIDVYLKW